MLKSDLLHALQIEIRRHTFDTFVDGPPSVAQGGKGIVTPGCVYCRKRIFTIQAYTDHICDEVIPALLDKLSSR